MDESHGRSIVCKLRWVSNVRSIVHLKRHIAAASDSEFQVNMGCSLDRVRNAGNFRAIVLDSRIRKNSNLVRRRRHFFKMLMKIQRYVDSNQLVLCVNVEGYIHILILHVSSIPLHQLEP